MKKTGRKIVNKKNILLSLICIGLIFTNSISACTIFTSKQGDTVLVGNNEDFWNPDPIIMVYPPEVGKFGRIFFMFEWLPGYWHPFGGVNDQGLFYDICSRPYYIPQNSTNKPTFEDGYLMAYALEVCSTVDEVLFSSGE